MVTNLGDIYHLAMISIGIFGVIISLVSVGYMIYSGNRKHKLALKQYEAKNGNVARNVKSSKRTRKVKKAKRK